MRVLHWFRSDLRLLDNTSIARAASHAEQMGFVFVFDDRLLAGPASGEARVRLLRACVERLASELEARGHRLWIRQGDPVELLPELASRIGARVVTWNRDYSPYAAERDQRVEQALARVDVRVRTFKDRVVFESDEIRTQEGGAYKVFTPYRDSWWRRLEEEGLDEASRIQLPGPIAGVARGALPSESALGVDGDDRRLPGVTEETALRRLRRFLEDASADYGELRDRPAVDGTSRLSPYLRLGVISVRRCFSEARAWMEEAPNARAGVSTWLDELVWREFYHAVLAENPHVMRSAYRPEYDALEWEEADEHFEAWCRGETGYPFVDAAMRQLRGEGFMHNRGRMVVASFLTKHLGIDWRRGERFFMQQLFDGDPASNNGGWQWAASTGTDAQPWFRIFNPIRQGERFDADGAYIRQWVPELEGMDASTIHTPWKAPLEAGGYPAPLVEHAEARKRALARYERVRSG